MFRKTITTLAAAAVALTTLAAAPASARDGDDLVKLLAGATALIVIGNAISDSKKDDRPRYVYRDPRPAPVYRAPVYRAPVYRAPQTAPVYRNSWQGYDKRHDEKRYDYRDSRHTSRHDDRRWDHKDDRRQSSVNTCYTKSVGRNDTRTYCTPGRR
ncbi:hypothetical protein [Pseudooceanicola nanhaiensis]|uniref:hypothetical protein n=1 Tax=Pseudooceanicola nanhaiensis TaxID=375761 RepID=UPI001CD72B88|nr:hypothetical protein [Pseudooceanicola nanhaiensis]MCA0921383.1 hypothetical protein [Pseudooceanicola nanhaiensis]